MKLIRKLNPLQPILPALCLLIAFAWVGYDSFFREKYTEEEKNFFGSAIGGIKNLGHQYLNDARKITHGLNFEFKREFCIDEDDVVSYEEAKILDNFVQEFISTQFHTLNFQKNKEIPIHSIFNSYIEKAKEFDPLLAEKYKDFKLENGLSDKEINQIYFSHDTIQNMYHLARFEMQLSKMYHDDIQLIMNHNQELFDKKNGNYSVTPYIVNKTSEIYTHISYPFDTSYTKLVYPKGIQTKFNEKGHLIIPTSLRNTNQIIKIHINCLLDTIYSYRYNYEN